MAIIHKRFGLGFLLIVLPVFWVGIVCGERLVCAFDEEVKAKFGARGFVRKQLFVPDGLPEQFSVEMEHKGRLKEIYLWRHSVRGPGYEVRGYRYGQYYSYEPGESRTYQGVVVGEEDSAVAATLGKHGLSASVYVGGKRAWRVMPVGRAVRGAKRSDHVVIDEEDAVLPVGMCGQGLEGEVLVAESVEHEHDHDSLSDLAGVEVLVDEGGYSEGEPEIAAAVRGHLRLAQIAFDVDNKVFRNLNSDAAEVEERVDEIVNRLCVIYARDSLITYELTGLIIRETEFYDYELNDEKTSLGEFKDKWQSKEAGNGGFSYDLGHLITANNSGGTLGLAWVDTICGGLRYAWSVNTVGVIAHEVGHNWGLNHCNDNGDCHIMCSGYGGCNGNPSFFGDPGALNLRDRSGWKGCLTDTGGFETQVPPRAFSDRVTISVEELNGTGELSIDVLDNDHDGNLDPLSIGNLSSPTELGATLSVSGGKVLYTPAGANIGGVDTFTYACRDDQGNQDEGTVTVDITYPRLVGYWKLDESGGGSARDSVGDHDASLEGELSFDTDSVEGALGGGLEFDGQDDYIEIPAMNLNSNSVSMTAWIKWNGSQNDWAGILFSRSGSSVAGLSMKSDGELRYHWNGSQGSYDWKSGLVVPIDKWVLVGLVVRPDRAIIHLYDGVLTSNYRFATHDIEEFDGKTRIGYDNGNRYFRGAIDDVRVYNYSIYPVQIEVIARGGICSIPSPHDWAGGVSTETNLIWEGTAFSQRYYVYLGSQYNAVAGAGFESAEFKGIRNEGAINPSLLENGKTYYWRVDEILSDGSVLSGGVWRFTTGGSITRQVWQNIGSGNSLSGLKDSANYPNSPDIVDHFKTFEAPTDWAEAYGTRMHGYLEPATGGDYTFWIASDDNSELWLSSDEDPGNASLIAKVSAWTKSRKWDDYPEQKSAAIGLEGGKRYYIMALHKEGGGGDNLSVAWEGPDCPKRSVIHGQWLRPVAGNEMPGFDRFVNVKDAAGERTAYSGTVVGDLVDPDGEGLNYSKSAGPGWLEVSYKGNLSGVPGDKDVGTNYFVVRGEDSSGEYNESIVSIEVVGSFSGSMGISDLVELAGNWLSEGCVDGSACQGSDLDDDEDVDMGDFGVQSGNWLVDMEPGLVGHWSFNDAWGTIARDGGESGDGEFVNMDEAAIVEGQVWNGLRFGGVDEHVRVSGFKGIGGSGSRTVSVWIKTVDTEGEIVGWGKIGVAGGRWVLRTEEGGRVRLEVGGGAIMSESVVCDGQWHHVGVVLDDDGSANLDEIVLYVDGALQDTGVVQSVVVGTVIDDEDSTDLHIGVWPPTARYFAGLIDEVRIFDEALSTEAIREFYYLTNDLKGWWRFDESSGLTGGDGSLNGIDGMLLNMEGSEWVEGKKGNCLSFDGVDDYVHVHNFKGISGVSSRSVCAWIKTTDRDGEILSWGQNATPGGRWILVTERSGFLRLEVGGGAVVGSTVVSDDAWHHVCAILDSDGTPNTNEVRLYVDGILEVPSSVAEKEIDTVTGPDFKIGVWNGGLRYFEGLIDDVRVFDRALTVDEIAVIMQ